MRRTRPAATVIQEEFSKTTQRGMYQWAQEGRARPSSSAPNLPERGEPVRADP